MSLSFHSSRANLFILEWLLCFSLFPFISCWPLIKHILGVQKAAIPLHFNVCSSHRLKGKFYRKKRTVLGHCCAQLRINLSIYQFPFLFNHKFFGPPPPLPLRLSLSAQSSLITIPSESHFPLSRPFAPIQQQQSQLWPPFPTFRGHPSVQSLFCFTHPANFSA